MTQITPIAPLKPLAAQDAAARLSETRISEPRISEPRIWALIPCAGTGTRAGTAMPKQYQKVAGLPMVLHTLAAFAGVRAVAETVVVISAGDRFFSSVYAAPARQASQEIATVLVAGCGGSTRAASVFNGLNFLLNQGADLQDWVLVHDAARCLVTPAQIQALIDACLPDDVGGLLAHKLADTLKSESEGEGGERGERGEGGGRVASTISRSDKWLAQTPQMFRIGPLRQALEAAGDQVTDESSAMEASGLKPKLVPGSAQNFKVTYPEDFALAEAVIHARQRLTPVPAADAASSLTISSLTIYDYP